MVEESCDVEVEGEGGHDVVLFVDRARHNNQEQVENNEDSTNDDDYDGDSHDLSRVLVIHKEEHENEETKIKEDGTDESSDEVALKMLAGARVDCSSVEAEGGNARRHDGIRD